MTEQKNFALSITEINKKMVQNLTESKYDESVQLIEMHVNRIWNEIRKELLKLANGEKFRSKRVATIEGKVLSSKITVIYHKKLCDVYKSYDIPHGENPYRIIIRMASYADVFGFTITPQEMKEKGKWSIEFTRS